VICVLECSTHPSTQPSTGSKTASHIIQAHLGAAASFSSSPGLSSEASPISVSSPSTSGSCSAAATAADSTRGTRRGSRGMTAWPRAFRMAARVARALERSAHELSRTCADWKRVQHCMRLAAERCQGPGAIAWSEVWSLLWSTERRHISMCTNRICPVAITQGNSHQSLSSNIRIMIALCCSALLMLEPRRRALHTALCAWHPELSMPVEIFTARACPMHSSLLSQILCSAAGVVGKGAPG
jgi:hypothetical protein